MDSYTNIDNSLKLCTIPKELDIKCSREGKENGRISEVCREGQNIDKEIRMYASEHELF